MFKEAWFLSVLSFAESVYQNNKLRMLSDCTWAITWLRNNFESERTEWYTSYINFHGSLCISILLSYTILIFLFHLINNSRPRYKFLILNIENRFIKLTLAPVGQHWSFQSALNLLYRHTSFWTSSKFTHFQFPVFIVPF